MKTESLSVSAGYIYIVCNLSSEQSDPVPKVIGRDLCGGGGGGGGEDVYSLNVRI